MSTQAESIKKKNEDFFQTHFDSYQSMVESLDTYKNIFRVVNKEVAGIPSLIDIGNGGVFAYDPQLVSKITAVDLFLDNLDPKKYPNNVSLKQGNALALNEPDNSYDGTLMVMLIHHLAGIDCVSTENNLPQCLQECFRILKPGGKLIIVESCVPAWLYWMEKMLFPVTNFLISKFLSHPMTYQYTRVKIQAALHSIFGNCTTEQIPKGKYVIQLGWKVPSIFTPVQPVLFVAFKNR